MVLTEGEMERGKGIVADRGKAQIKVRVDRAKGQAEAQVRGQIKGRADRASDRMG
jgi:hypothetical protein